MTFSLRTNGNYLLLGEQTLSIPARLLQDEDDDNGLQDALNMEEEPARKRHKSSRNKLKHICKLLNLAAEGRHHKLKKLLQRHPEMDVNSYNSEGFTALHQVRF